MAVRNIRKDNDEVLRKKSKKVDKVNERIINLLDDMAETMYKSGGVGLAAPQVGILRRVVVFDSGEGLRKLINPVILEKSGEQIEVEGCLSIPGVYGEVKRPYEVKVKALDVDGKESVIEGQGLPAVIMSHEIDHLDGILFTDKAERILSDEELEQRRNNREN